MDSEIESLKAEVARLGGETVALQIILGRLLDMLVRSGQVSSGLITQIFAQADLAAETAVLRSKDASIPSHTETTFRSWLSCGDRFLEQTLCPHRRPLSHDMTTAPASEPDRAEQGMSADRTRPLPFPARHRAAISFLSRICRDWARVRYRPH